MGRPRRVVCRACGRHIDECGPLSRRGLCEDDSVSRQLDNISEITAGRGPFYDRYQAGMRSYAARLAARDERSSS